MPVATLETPRNRSAIGDLWVTLDRVPWQTCVHLDDSLGESSATPLIYHQGRSTIVTTSRRHDWFARRFSQCIVAPAQILGIPIKDAGSAALRREDWDAGVERDETFRLDADATSMRGPKNIDLMTQPPPDLAVEVVITHPAQEALATYAHLGVPEIWVFQPDFPDCSFLQSGSNGRYAPTQPSRAFPQLTNGHLVEQLRLAEQKSLSEGLKQLPDWTRATIVPSGGEPNPTRP